MSSASSLDTPAVLPPASTALLPPWRRSLPAIAVAIAALLAHHYFSQQAASTGLVLSLWLGLLFGMSLQRSRFCFYCSAREWLDERNGSGLLAIVLALAIGTIGYWAVFGAFMPTINPSRLPPQAHIGPVSWVLALGACLFGIGMALAGSCVSALLYRAGEGALPTLLGLLGTLIGFALGFMLWNPLYLAAIQQAPTIWLPHYLGYQGALLLQLGLLGLLAALIYKRHQAPPAAAKPISTLPWWQRPWSPTAGGLLVAGIGVIAYLRVSPLGVTAELGSLARTAAAGAELLPSTLHGLDGLRGCATALKTTLWSNNGVFIVALVAGSWASAMLSGQFRWQAVTANNALRNLLGGVLMGVGALLALGCTVGTLLSGIVAGALSGWVFLVFVSAGLLIGKAIRARWL